MNGSPIPMILHCPECRTRHVDVGEFQTRPHHTHACQACGFVWRPSLVDTVGVQFLPGFKDVKQEEALAGDVVQYSVKEKNALRLEGAKALLKAAFELLNRRQDRDPFSDERRLSAGAFTIHLAWALQESPDGLHYDIEKAEWNANNGDQSCRKLP